MKFINGEAVRRFIGTVMVVAIAFGASAAGHNFRGEKTLGVRAGYAGYNRSALAGVEFTYRFNRWLRIAPAADYVFSRDAADALLVDVNMQFPINFSMDRMDVYPEIGVNFSGWNFHDMIGLENGTTMRTSRFGLNLGAGYEVDLTPSFRIGVVGYYTFIKKFHSFNALVNVAYRF